MKHLVVFTFVFVIVGCAIKVMSQSMADVPANSPPFNLFGQSVMAYDHRYEGVKGTPNFLEDFRPGTIELKKGKFTDVLINYDAYTDNLLAINDKIKEVVQMRKDMVVNFTLKSATGQVFSFSKQSLNGTPTFMLDLVRDTISLFCRVIKTIKKADFGGAYRIQDSKHDEFVTSDVYYVAIGTKDLQELERNRKSFLRMFPEFEDQLSAYLKQNKIDFKDPWHLKLLIQYVNTLEEKI